MDGYKKEGWSLEASPPSDKKMNQKVWSLCGRRYEKRVLTGKASEL